MFSRRLARSQARLQACVASEQERFDKLGAKWFRGQRCARSQAQKARAGEPPCQAFSNLAATARSVSASPFNGSTNTALPKSAKLRCIDARYTGS